MDVGQARLERSGGRVTTTAPNPGREQDATGDGRRPERLPGRPTPDRDRRTTWSRLVMLVNIVLIAGVAIIGLTHVRSEDTGGDAVAADPTSGPASTLADPDARP